MTTHGRLTGGSRGKGNTLQFERNRAVSDMPAPYNLLRLDERGSQERMEATGISIGVTRLL